MYGYDSNQPCCNRPQGLPYGSVRLVDAHYLAPLRLFVMVGYDGIEHRVAQTVKQAVYTNCNGKQYKPCCKARQDHHGKAKQSGNKQDKCLGSKHLFNGRNRQLHEYTGNPKARIKQPNLRRV